MQECTEKFKVSIQITTEMIPEFTLRQHTFIRNKIYNLSLKEHNSTFAISHVSHHHVAEFSLSPSASIPVSLSNITVGVAFRLKCPHFRSLNMSLTTLLLLWLALMTCEGALSSIILSLNSLILITASAEGLHTLNGMLSCASCRQLGKRYRNQF